VALDLSVLVLFEESAGVFVDGSGYLMVVRADPTVEHCGRRRAFLEWLSPNPVKGHIPWSVGGVWTPMSTQLAGVATSARNKKK
jgi:hypothetical protein